MYMYMYICIYTEYIKITAFQASPVEKERNKRLNFTFKASNSKFQAETMASFRPKNWNKDIKIGGMIRF